jgi:proline dehydrogenase
MLGALVAADCLNSARSVNPLIRLIPPFLVRYFAEPYVAGDSLEKAIQVVADQWEQHGRTSTLDLLAEGIESEAITRQNLATYLRMVDSIADEQRFAADSASGVVAQGVRTLPTVSIKPSSYTTAPLEAGGDAAGSADACRAICRHARDRGVRTTIDMEGAPWTDFTLDLLDELHAEGLKDVGCVLQTRLERTEKDLDRLPEGCRVRLVIGIYKEPASIATQDKRVMKDRLLAYAETLLGRGHYVEFATHDDAYVHRFVDEVVPRVGAGPGDFEVQMLYGVPRDRLLDELTSRGILTRLYVPFALGWPMAIAYLRRRLDEAPSMMFKVARNMLRAS